MRQNLQSALTVLSLPATAKVEDLIDFIAQEQLVDVKSKVKIPSQIKQVQSYNDKKVSPSIQILSLLPQIEVKSMRPKDEWFLFSH